MRAENRSKRVITIFFVYINFGALPVAEDPVAPEKGVGFINADIGYANNMPKIV